MGATKATSDGLRAAVRAHIKVTIDIRAHGRIRVDVVWKQGSVNDHGHYAGLFYRFNFRVYVHAYTQARQQVRHEHTLQ